MPDSVYKVIEIVGSSETSWEDAARRAIERAAAHLEDLRVAEVVQLDIKMDDNAMVAYRTKLKVSFKYHEEL
jgi:flavin-binding protein dodecin